MSKIAILLCVMIVGTLDASADYLFEVVENKMKSDIDSGLSELETSYNSTMQDIDKSEENLFTQYNSIIFNISTDIDYYAAKAWDKVHDIWVNTSLKCDIEENLSGYDCFKAIKEVVDKGLEFDHSVVRCTIEAWANIFHNKNLFKAKTLYDRVSLDLMALRNRASCSSRYNKITQFELIALCNERFGKQVNEKINKLPLAVARIKNTTTILNSLLNDAPDCGNDWNNIAYQADLEEGIRKAKTCYQQLELEQQLQTSTAAN